MANFQCLIVLLVPLIVFFFGHGVKVKLTVSSFSICDVIFSRFSLTCTPVVV